MSIFKKQIAPGRSAITPWILVLCALAGQASAEILSEPQLEAAFKSKVRPFVETYCIDCHGGEKPKADLNLNVYTNLRDVLNDFEYWELARE